MKKPRLISVLFVMLLATAGGPAFPCTSFAIYSDNILYGMNFDYPPTEMRFSVYAGDGMNLFKMEFQQGGRFMRTVQMNDRGLFAAMQLIYPSLPAKADPEDNELYVWQLENTLSRFTATEEVAGQLKGKRLIPSIPSIHCLFADPSGTTMIAEAGERENGILYSREKFAVMTNFKHSDFAGKPDTEVSGIGADRYVTARQYLSGHAQGFDLESGWSLLKKTAQNNTAYPTICSMMFDPVRGDVYIVLQRDFNRIWKVSISKKTITAFRGFSQPREIKLPPQGMLASEIIALGE